MKIGEFAARNGVTTKLLRHYDDIGLLKPAQVDGESGYRVYEPAQSHRLDWILILKNLDFTLAEIGRLLDGPTDSLALIAELARKRREIGLMLDEQIGKRMQIERLVLLLEKEGFHMNANIDLMRFEQKSVHDIKKNMPNTERFLENVQDILALCQEETSIHAIRFDVSHFKRVNDELGFDIGDRVIVACHDVVTEAVKPFGEKATVGRAGGDEFICLVAFCSPKEAYAAAEDMLSGMERYDWNKLGCPFPISAKIGMVSAKWSEVPDVRPFLDRSYDLMYEAARKGPGNIVHRIL